MTNSFLDALKYDRVLAQRNEICEIGIYSIIDPMPNLRTTTTRWLRFCLTPLCATPKSNNQSTLIENARWAL
jgi:hypothetical protein